MLPDVARAAVTAATVSPPQLEYGVVLGAGEPLPRVSWKIESAIGGWQPERYELTLWRDGRVEQTVIRETTGQVFEPWPFPELHSRERVEVSVRVGHSGEWSPASPRTAVELGLLNRADWSADYISPSSFGGLDDAAPMLFTTVTLDSTPVTARLYATARGLYDFSINGAKVGDDVLTPGWTAYQKRLRYQTYDVTALLKQGENHLRAVLGNGWYRGQLVWPGNRSSYGSRLALLAQLEVTLADGSVLRFGTDETWRACESGILFDDLYDGQHRDLRIADDPEGKPHQPVVVLPHGAAELVAPTAPQVGAIEQIAPVAITRSPTGVLLVDFGQNLVGWVRLTVRGGVAGETVTIRHAEVLEGGELGLRPLRSAKATSSYVLSGAPDEVLVPTFTFHGFRYASIEGLDDVRADDVVAIVLGSRLQRTGWFESSSRELNQLHSNVVWSMRGNFLDIPTDCPARDERLGWTGDIQAFAPTANYLFDTSGFLAGWLRDLAAEQRPDGGVPNVIPDVLGEPDPASAGWGDAATIVPASLFTAFADARLLERQYASMVGWVQKVSSLAGPRDIWDQGAQFGDWLDPTAPPDDPSRAQADPGVVATAHFARSTWLLAQAARVLGKTDDAEHYTARHRAIVSAFNREYVTDAGIVQSDCQTVYALALEWELLDSPSKREHASERLAALVRAADNRVSTGFIGTPLILSALERAGHPELAVAMLMQRESPSWLYAVSMGATTVWERWDSMLPDGSINPGSMTSFNHYAYGAVADWMHRSVAGLAPISPGWSRVRIAPTAASGLSSASARHDSPYGLIEVHWTRTEREFTLTATVPIGVTAEVWMPGAGEPLAVGSGRHSFAVASR